MPSHSVINVLLYLMIQDSHRTVTNSYIAVFTSLCVCNLIVFQGLSSSELHRYLLTFTLFKKNRLGFDAFVFKVLVINSFDNLTISKLS